jgi:type IV pilus assembly protein PilM
MLNTKSFLTVDFGAGSLKLAEFEINESGGLRLNDFCIKPLGLEGAQEASREKVILAALQEAIAEKDFKSKTINVCAPGFHVFSKFVKLPPVDAAKVGQIIQYEAQQNVPFPLAEVVWDYQILGSTAGGELEVLLVAIKSEVVEGLFRVVEAAKLKLELCDASPAALCNAFRYNYGDLEECTMLLDIGAKTSNLLFFEKGKVFSRSISLGANSITQDFATEAKLKFDEAERIKIAEGFVSLGGAYEEPDNAHQAAISKIARQFMTKLHIQVNQTMQFYRGQQGGSAPQRLFLSGGASIMDYTAQFFSEKLSIPVEYFNPFHNIEFGPALNLEALSPVAHSMGEVVGLALRNLATCPVEMNLMPESTLRWQSFNQKKPYFLASVFSVVLVAFAVGFLFEKLAGNKEKQIDRLAPEVQTKNLKSDSFQKAYGKLQQAQKDSAQIAAWMQQRYYWGDFMAEVRLALIRSESEVQKKFAAQKPGLEVGVWVDQMLAAPNAQQVAEGNPPSAPSAPPGYGGYGGYGMDPRLRGRDPRLGGVPTEAPPPPVAVEQAVVVSAATNNAVVLVCRAVSLNDVDPSANTAVAYAVENQIKASPLVDPQATVLSPNLTDDVNGTFTFTVNVKLLNPLNF